MKLGIMQPYFLPYIGYFQLIEAVDKFVIYDDVQFIKGGWINRNNILLNNRRFLFNLLLKGASSNKLITDIHVQENQSKLIKTIESAYKKAPMYNIVFPLFLQIMSFKEKNLARFVGNSIEELCKYMRIHTQLVYSSDLKKDSSLKAQEKILHICRLLDVDNYLNAIGGQVLYTKSDFENCGVRLNFIKTELISYKQFNDEFIPNLSIIDILMFNSIEEVDVMLNKFELVH